MQIEIYNSEAELLKTGRTKFKDTNGQEFFIVDGIILIIKQDGDKKEINTEDISP